MATVEETLRERFIENNMDREEVTSALKAISALVGSGSEGGHYLSAEEFGNILLQASEG